MSGHSKWSTIKHKKAVVDAKRGNIFTKMANAITVAVKKGGGVADPEMNFNLRLAIDKAKSVNMPKENIERAIDKGSGKGGGKEIEELILEGYGPGGAAIIIETLTDNHNRTVSELKNILEKNGGRLGEPGSVMFQFERVGEINFEGTFDDKLQLELIDMGMKDFETNDGYTKIFTEIVDAKVVAEYLKVNARVGIEMSVGYRPKVAVPAKEDQSALENLFVSLDQHDDVQDIYANIS